MDVDQAENEILNFLRKELHHRGKNNPVDRETPILSTQMLDSLFLVDLIVFLENKFTDKGPRLAQAKKADLDSVAKISSFLDL